VVDIFEEILKSEKFSEKKQKFVKFDKKVEQIEDVSMIDVLQEI